jgi:putative transposase
MSNSFVQNYLHITFSTKRRLPLIKEDIEEELYAYIAGICKNLKCQPLKVGGYYDHIHIACMLHQTVCLSKLLEVIKSHSSLWIKNKKSNYDNFYWQEGYAAFSVRKEGIQHVIDYIANQKQHHRKNSFQKELVNLLVENEVEFIEKYLWD